MQKLLLNPEKVKTMGEAGKIRALNHFSIQSYTQAFEQLFEQLS